MQNILNSFSLMELLTVAAATAVTVAAYLFGLFCYRRSGSFSLLHPVPVASLLIAGLIGLTQIPATYYEQGCSLLRWLLGPATVALALPLYYQLQKIHQLIKPIAIGVTVGSILAIITALLPAQWFGGSEIVLRSLASKSVTTPIAIAIAEEIDGLTSLAAGAVILTGILGICIAPWIFRLCKVTDARAKGFALGLAAHGIGTARALEDGQQCGAFSTLALCLTGIFSSMIIPAIIVWLL
jgi:predicted murein hydrolase (TIGR00659 family)